MREEREQHPVFGPLPKPLTLQGFETNCERLRGDDSRVGEGTRTPDIQIHSLTL